MLNVALSESDKHANVSQFKKVEDKRAAVSTEGMKTKRERRSEGKSQH